MLKDYEKKVIGLLVSEILSSDRLNNVLRDCEFIDYEYTKSGYFLNIRSSHLPKGRIVCSEPIIIGEADNITCGFVIFIENGELTIECHSWSEENVSEDFRDKDVQVRQVKIESGKFVSI